MIRRLLGRLRTSRAGALYRRLEGTSEEDGRPWMTTSGDGPGELATEKRREFEAAERVEAVDEPVEGSSRVSDARSVIDTAPTNADPGLVPALNRVADAFERMAASVEVEHREREARLDAIEHLLREFVSGLAPPTAVPPVVVGGSISLEMLRDRPEVAEIDLSDPQVALNGSDDSPLDAA